MAQNNIYSNDYVYGSVARKMAAADTVRRQEERRQREVEEQQRRVKEKRRAKRVHKVNVIYTLALIGMMSVMIYMFVGYVQLQASIQANAAEVNRMEKELSKLTESNNLTALELDTNLDYNKIYEIATKELGMVYPANSQVIEYNSTPSEYVKQYKDIPQ